MAHPLRRGLSVATSRLPIWTAVLSDGLAIIIAVIGLIAGGEISRGDDLPDSVLLDFTATWCQPCQRMSPIVHKLQQQGYAIQKIDVDQQPKLAQSYRIELIPTFVLVVNGEEVTRITGPTSEEQLRRMAQQATRKQPAAKANPARESIPLPEYARSTERGDDRNPTDNVELGDPQPAPESSFGMAKDRRQPKEASTKTSLFPSLFSKKKPAELAERNRRDERMEIRGQNPGAIEETLSANLPLSASTRIRVTDDTGSNFGSGTIIDSHVGCTTILTCGHIFRQPAAKGNKTANTQRVEVDIFLPGGRHQTYPATVVEYDLEGDVGVVTIDTAGKLPLTPIAPLAEQPVMNDRLVSIGCGGGERPTAEPIRVTALNRYDGPENIECTGVPIQGRSGGGLFDAHGQLVGICIAADQEGQRGLYAGLKPVHDLLAKAGMKQFTPPSPRKPEETEFVPGTTDIAAATDRSDAPPASENLDHFLNRAFGDTPLGPSSTEISQLFAQSPDAEVICLVRPKNGDAGRVVILNQPSTKFVSYLLDSIDEPKTAAAPRAASLRVEDASDPLGDAWVADEEFGVPKRAPDFEHEYPRKAAPADSAHRMSKRSRFGSRSEN